MQISTSRSKSSNTRGYLLASSCIFACGTYKTGEQDFLLYTAAGPRVQASDQQGWKFRTVRDMYWIQNHCSFNPGASEEDEPSIR